MRSFNKLANLHSVFFKKAANPTQGISAADHYRMESKGRNGPLTPFARAMGIPEKYDQDQVRRQQGIAQGGLAASKLVNNVAKGSGIPSGLMAATPHLIGAAASLKKDIPGMSRAVPGLIQDYAGRNNPKVNYGGPDEFNDIKNVQPRKY